MSKKQKSKVSMKRFEAIIEMLGHSSRNVPLTTKTMAERILGIEGYENLSETQELNLMKEKQKVSASMSTIDKMLYEKGQVLANIRSNKDKGIEGGYYVGSSDDMLVELDKSCKRAIGLMKSARKRVESWVKSGAVSQEQIRIGRMIIASNAANLKEIYEKQDMTLEEEDPEIDFGVPAQQNETGKPDFVEKAAFEDVDVDPEDLD
jgi:hypothetical protein